MSISLRIPEKYLLINLSLFLGAGLLLSGAPDALSQEDPISYAIPYVQSAPIIDGEITEGEWAGAERVYLDNETRPSQNVPALVDTEVLMMEDGANFYVAFMASDPEPNKIRAFYRDRDSCFDDDFVGAVIDTFNDERRAFEFFANPLGVQMDMILDDVVGDEDASWNAIWDSAGQITDTGYVVEMKIPLNQLRFPGGVEKQTWGIALFRSYPRNKRHTLSNYTRNYDLSCYLCQFKKAQGFGQLEQDMNIRFVPAVTASYSEDRPEPQTDEWQTDSKLDAGLDIRWGINEDFYLNATINPDFSQVEADVAQLDVNTTFSLFFPERREFFLDGADYFNTHTNLVYTRNIASPDYGLKLTGKRGNHTHGLFFANDEMTNFIIPGNQGSVVASLEDTKSVNTAYRYRLDINRNTNLGMILTDRRGDDYSNTVIGVDGNIRIGESDTIEMQVMKSYSEYPEQIQEDHDQKPKIDDFAYLISYAHRDNNWSWGARYTEYGDDFRADMGFINRVDYRKFRVSGAHNWRFGPGSTFSRFSLGGDWDITYDESGHKLEEEGGIRLNAEGPLQSFMFLGYNQGERFYDGEYFDEYVIFFFGRIRPMAGMDIGFDLDVGDSIDYANTRLGKMLTFGPRIEMRIGKHFEVDLRHNYQRMDIEGQRLYTTSLSDLRFTYQFNLRSFLRAIIQYSDTKRDLSLYDPDDDFLPEARSKNLTTQFLYSYKINPQTRFFIGYSDTGFQDDELSKIHKTNRTVFTKVSYAWSP
jgi:hypothetical protein